MARSGSAKQQQEDAGKIPPIRPDGLQLDEDRHFQERWWTAERVAWLVFALVFIATALGALGGGGPLAEAKRHFEAASVDYPRIARWLATDDIKVSFEPGAAEHTLTLGNGFAGHFSIESIQPSPERTVVTELGHRLHFAFEDGSSGSVVMSIRPSRPGFAQYGVAVDGGAPALLSTLVLP